MATLYARVGDSQALKALAAAGLSGSQVQFSAVPTLAAVRSKASSPFGNNTVAFVDPSGLQLTDGNAIAKFLGGFTQLASPHTFTCCLYNSGQARFFHNNPCALFSRMQL